MSKEPPELVEPSTLLFESVQTVLGYCHSAIAPCTYSRRSTLTAAVVANRPDTKQGPPLGGRPRFDASLAVRFPRVKRPGDQVEVDLPPLGIDAHYLHSNPVTEA